jgi:hypothetical protein
LAYDVSSNSRIVTVYILPTAAANMSDTESDEDMRRAIALSLQRSSSPPPGHIIDLVSSDDEDDDLDAPVATKKHAVMGPPFLKRPTKATQSALGNLGKETTPGEQKPGPFANPPVPPAITIRTTIEDRSMPKPPITGGMLHDLDRKQMEEERLARVNQRKRKEVEHVGEANGSRKRKLSNSLSRNQQQDPRNLKVKLSAIPSIPGDILSSIPSARAVSRAGEDDAQFLQESRGIQPLSLRTEKLQDLIDIVSPGEVNQKRREVISFRDQQALRSSSIQFPDGVVKKTWAYGFPREDDIKIEEVFQKNDLELAVLSAFQVDPEWVASKLNPTTRVIWVLQAKTELEVSNDVLLCFQRLNLPAYQYMTNF